MLNGFLKTLRSFWQSLSSIGAMTTESPGDSSSTIDAMTPEVSKDDGTGKQAEATPTHSFGLQTGSTLLELVGRQPPPVAELNQARRLEMIFQLTCLLTLGMITTDLASDFRTLQLYMDSLHKSIENLQLAGQSCNNVMWQVQVSDHSESHSRRIWRAASFAWVMKHCTYTVQLTLKEWLLAFFTGKPVEKPYRLDPFHFSYAS
jgi:hypothetical protein